MSLRVSTPLVSQGEDTSLICSLFLPLASLFITVQLGLQINVFSPTLSDQDMLSHASCPFCFSVSYSLNALFSGPPLWILLAYTERVFGLPRPDFRAVSTTRRPSGVYWPTLSTESFLYFSADISKCNCFEKILETLSSNHVWCRLGKGCNLLPILPCWLKAPTPTSV